MFYNDRRAALEAAPVRRWPGFPRVFLCNSGTEAIEAAIKFARLTTGRTGVIAAMRGFHGRTMGALSATWEKKYREPFEPLVPGFSHVPYNNLEALDAAVTDQTAAVLLEVVQGEGGVHPGIRRIPAPARSASASERGAHADHRRGPDRLWPHRAGCSPTSTTACSPTCSAWPNRSPAACRWAQS